jgi:hypothetical protein
MCADLTITTEHGLVYNLSHGVDGLHMTCHTDNAPALIFDLHVDGFTGPQVGHPMRFIGSTMSTPPVETVRRTG